MRTFKLDATDRTVILAADAEILGPMSEVDLGIGKRGWLEGWTGRNNILGWQIQVSKAADYDLHIVAEGTRSRPQVEIAAGNSLLDIRLPPRWERLAAGTVRLPAGKSTVTLRGVGDGHVKRLFSLELVRPVVAKSLAAKAVKSRPDTDWMLEAKYGLMFHWTSRTAPRRGAVKPYAEAVEAFNVEAFARTVAQSGAGYVVFTTSHEDFYWPGPNAAIDKVLKGRTCKRDLVSDLADALNKRGLRLMLYFHPGHDDEKWWKKTGFDQPTKTAYFRTWMAIIKDAGKRYKDRLAGWWFDDALLTYYPLNPPWSRMAAAAREGNADRLICWNSWIMPKVTEFGDLASGEAHLEMDLIRGGGHLTLDGTGRYDGGPQDGLQAHVTTPATKAGWVHRQENAPLGRPLYQTPKLIRMLTEAARRKCVVTLNLECYQDGSISRLIGKQFSDVRAALKKRRRARRN